MKNETDLHYELDLRDKGFALIAGLDEAGRGAWAGPVSAGAVMLPLDRADLMQVLDGVTDSKRLSPARREALFPVIIETALVWGVGFASNAEIDEIGIVPATRLAMCRALDQFSILPTPCSGIRCMSGSRPALRSIPVIRNRWARRRQHLLKSAGIA
jgi:ribonuclease HII